jgi:hypothetical protein
MFYGMRRGFQLLVGLDTGEQLADAVERSPSSPRRPGLAAFIPVDTRGAAQLP